MMSIRDRLEKQGHRKLRAFWRAPEPDNHGDWDVFEYFVDLLYTDQPDVDLETVNAVDAELATSERTVQDVLDGWRPAALRCGHSHCSQHFIETGDARCVEKA